VPAWWHEAVELAEIELRRRNVRLTPLRGRAPARLRVDPILIEQVLVNLMKNGAESIDAAPLGAAAAWSCAWCPSTSKACAWWSSRCTDTGQGLAPEVLERLFEAFFSTKAKAWASG
jgi:signal transduction histidine kinase